ncbi:MAG: Phospho-N-acetylmuramoyl-pentapeptide-transferase [Parcubacteria group bacterium Gr01-1014_48]|nr:MAG: Phospho-N-acetylmuramoyl-pentapeptide-transferase [Parcubacteria group bacterium Greene0416_14]TSC74145.1 MAG: Phospho-N-acetylmuramoyl-pentapeptide-transferase [Parcubacteria group bacterium Gr01-1014_48]TSD01698.1 MAG: Phospho-N-acetylmuramoyl-pentapeptide-transferase [Parcubacteria group bacterium Greene1014_15]TSD08168.1 MAG: Phospho-N-acetylmuramoyl-pentapeptide-transferase [Parcubacteria group bacterium Greene0714_4]
MILDVAKVFLPSTVSFTIGILTAPLLTHFLYKYKMWKKKAGKVATDGRATPLFNELHKHKEVGTPKMGGVLIWSSVFITIALFKLFSVLIPSEITFKLNFFSQNQTWLPLFTLIVGAGIGLIDDLLEVTGTGGYLAGGLSLKKRLLVVAITGLVGGLWFFTRLEVSSILIPFMGELELGAAFIPLFILVMLALYSGGVIDGIDGLAGGVFACIFAAYGGIAFFQNQIDLAAFCAVMTGGILSFLWFNIPPARFYMSETGTMGLTMTLAVVAFLTKAVMVLPIIAFPLFATTLSDVIQLLSKKYRGGKKVFHIAPLHHHFEALGWPGYKVTMRYWVISIILAICGMIVALVGLQQY